MSSPKTQLSITTETKTPLSPSSGELTPVAKVFCYCNGCSTEAKAFKIKKMGPNEGKLFYSCPNAGKVTVDSCTFKYMEGSHDGLATHKSKCKNKINPHKAIKIQIKKEGPNCGKWAWMCECSKQFEIIN